MYLQRIVLWIAAFSIVVPDRCFACLWDYDTLAMERQAFPEAQELIAGHFVRHSDAYYRWRLDDRTAIDESQRTPADYDDIAVAYDKLGRHDEAIETIRDKIDRWPDEGRYESEANLGTFLIHSGRFEEGLVHLDAAIEINPDAHFGREIYQKLLVEYVIERRKEDAGLPLETKGHFESGGFEEFVLAARMPEPENELAEIQAAVKGILGMMRFGQHDSPILLEALGDLLLSDYDSTDAKMLAARAYLRASYVVDDATAAAIYRSKASQAIEEQVARELPGIEAELKTEIEQGKAFFQQIAADEQAWIAAGRNVDTAFAEKYYAAPALQIEDPNWRPPRPEEHAARALVVILAVVVVIGIAFVAAIVVIVRWILRRRRTYSGKLAAK